MSEVNLKQKAAKGLLWRFLDQGGTQIFQFAGGIYIARILSPDDYGLMGMMAVFLGISLAFINSGFKSTLIQKGSSVTQDDLNVVFYFNIIVSLLFYILIYWSAPYIAIFFNEQKLILIARIISLDLILKSLGMVHQVIYEKKINFKTLTKINLIAILISVFLGIGFAITGFGVWALVAMLITDSMIRTILLWIINKWRPTFTFRYSVFKILFASGSKLLLSGILYQVSQNIYSIVIGKFFTVTDVGFYSQARKLQRRVGDTIRYSIQSTLFPVQSLIKDDVPRLKNTVRTNVKFTTFLTFPAIIGLMVIAEPFIKLFLTDKWLPSVSYLQILSVAGLFTVITSAIASFIIPLGKFNFTVRFSIFSNILFLLIIAIGIFLKVNLNLLVAGKALQSFIVLIINIYYSNKFINYSLKEILIDIAAASIISIVMGVVVYIIGFMFSISYGVLILQIIVGASIYFLFNLIFNKAIMKEIFAFIRTL